MPTPPTPDAIRAARAAAGLSQSAAAALCPGVSVRTWQGWEIGRGRMHPTVWAWFLASIRRL